MDWEQFHGFYKKKVEERQRMVGKPPQPDINVLDLMSENVIGIQQLPLSVAPYFTINNKRYLAPMSVEESSVVAAASYAAKLSEGFEGQCSQPIATGELLCKGEVEQYREQLLDVIKTENKSMIERGGHYYDVEFKRVGSYTVVVFHIDVRDSMGANRVNSVGEALKAWLESKGVEVIGAIVTNANPKRWVKVKGKWALNKIKDVVNVQRFLAMYEWAKHDPWRAVTNNKGIMNGVDAVCIATGQDWRAVEAAAHYYTSQNGYQPMAHWYVDRQYLIGEMTLHLSVGTVGGAVKVNPITRFALEISGVSNWCELAMLMAAVGLANNFAAMRAISKEGIQKGHMELHATNVAIMAGAHREEVEAVVSAMLRRGKVSVSVAKEVLRHIRENTTERA